MYLRLFMPVVPVAVRASYNPREGGQGALWYSGLRALRKQESAALRELAQKVRDGTDLVLLCAGRVESCHGDLLKKGDPGRSGAARGHLQQEEAAL